MGSHLFNLRWHKENKFRNNFLILFEKNLVFHSGKVNKRSTENHSHCFKKSGGGDTLWWHFGLHGSYFAIYVLRSKSSKPINKATHGWQAKTQVSYLLFIGVALLSTQEGCLIPLWRYNLGRHFKPGSGQHRQEAKTPHSPWQGHNSLKST